VVVFDLGGVLIDWNPRYLYRKLFDDDEGMERFLSEVCSPEWNTRQDAGRLWREAVSELTTRHPDQAAMIAAYHLRWPEMLGGDIPEAVELLKELKQQRLRLYALTNWSHETFPVARSRFAFLDWFEGIVVSGEERMVKPDPAIFLRLFDAIRHPTLARGLHRRFAPQRFRRCGRGASSAAIRRRPSVTPELDRPGSAHP